MDREIIVEAQRTYAANLEHGNFAAMEMAITGALSRLTVSPLPGEIAELLDLAKGMPGYPVSPVIVDKLAAALERMARAHEVLKNDCAECFAENERLNQLVEAYKQQSRLWRHQSEGIQTEGEKE